MDPGIVADAIRASLDAADVRSKHIVTAVGGRDVMIKKIQTERVKEKQARELMRWEAEQHVPDVESVELDFQILDPGKSSDEMSVLLVAAKRDLIDSKLRILAEAGVTPMIVDVDAFALHNAFEVNYPGSDGWTRWPGERRPRSLPTSTSWTVEFRFSRESCRSERGASAKTSSASTACPQRKPTR